MCCKKLIACLLGVSISVWDFLYMFVILKQVIITKSVLKYALYSILYTVYMTVCKFISFKKNNLEKRDM